MHFTDMFPDDPTDNQSLDRNQYSLHSKIHATSRYMNALELVPMNTNTDKTAQTHRLLTA